MSVLIITTGGTIDKTYGAGAGVRDLDNGRSQVADILLQGRSLPHDIHHLMAKDSLDMQDDDRQIIADLCRSVPHARLVITHGTDTMVQTASVLAQAGLDDKTIILTGAAQPWCLKASDADFNLGLAIGAAYCALPGVYIAMNGQIFPHDGCEKNPVSGLFQAIGS